MEPLSKICLAEGRQIASDLTRVKARLGALGLFKTMHALDEATRAIGYELDERSPHRRTEGEAM